MLANTLLALLVVDAPLIRIRKRVVSIRDLLELLFGSFRVILVLVRVELDGQLLERLFDLMVVGVTLDPHDFVIVLSGRRLFLLLSLLSSVLLVVLLATVLACHQRARPTSFATR